MTISAALPLLAGRTAVITGGAQGLGSAMATVLSTAGANVVVADIDHDAATTRADELPSALGMGCDVTDEAEVSAVADAAVEAYGSLDIWINNAGFTRDASLRNLSLDDFRAVLDVHLTGSWLGIRAAAAVMREQKSGSIINVSSMSGKQGNPGQTNYSAAKAGVIGMTKAAAKELGRHNVRVNALQPGLIDTAMIRQMKPEVLESRITEIPLGRLGSPEDVGNVALFLASDLSAYLTGNVIEIAGGRGM